MATADAGDTLPDPEEAGRFEDLTVDDDLPLLERIVRYSRSQIALQRLVHVKMLGETAELAGYVPWRVIDWSCRAILCVSI